MNSMSKLDDPGSESYDVTTSQENNPSQTYVSVEENDGEVLYTGLLVRMVITRVVMNNGSLGKTHFSCSSQEKQKHKGIMRVLLSLFRFEPWLPLELCFVRYDISFLTTLS